MVIYNTLRSKRKPQKGTLEILPRVIFYSNSALHAIHGYLYYLVIIAY